MPFSRNNSATPMQQLLIALRFYSTNGFLITMGDYGGMDKSTVSRIIVRVSKAIASLAHIYIKLPRTQEDILRTQRNFYNIAAFPKVIGAIDCTHIKIQSPGMLLCSICFIKVLFFCLKHVYVCVFVIYK